MNDFFGGPLFQPTGTDWIDHAFTAAVLDDMEEDSDDTVPAYRPSAPVPKMTPELEAELMKDPEYRKSKRQIDEACAGINAMIRHAQRGWF